MNLAEIFHRHSPDLLRGFYRPIIVLPRQVIQHLLHLSFVQDARLETLHDERLHVESAKVDAEPPVGTMDGHNNNTTLVPHGFESVVERVFVSRTVDHYVDLSEVPGSFQGG